MAINLQPAFLALPAYRPIEFEVYAISIPTSYVYENAVVTIYKEGVPIGPAIRYKSNRTAPGYLPNVVEYYFKIDIQKYCQDSLGPTADISTNFNESSPCVVNSDLHADFFIEVRYEWINQSNGLLEQVPFLFDQSDTFTVFSISRKHLEPMSLEDIIGTYPTLTKFLTKSERVLDLCTDESATLSSINPFAVNGYKVSLYDSNNVLLSEAVAETFSVASFAMFTINTSIAALSSEVWVFGTPNFADPNLSYYVITFGSYFIVGPNLVYFKFSEEFVYNIKPSCCGLRSLRLHFMNLLGGVDSYTFNSEKDLRIKTTSDRSQKSLNWITGSSTPHNTTDVGFFKIKSEATQEYKLKSRILTNSQALWLSELLTSPKVYAEIDSNTYVPVIVEDVQQSISSNEGKIQFEIDVTLSNNEIIQRI